MTFLQPATPVHPRPDRYCFDAFQLDVRARQLLHGGDPVPVQGLVFDLLLYLASHPGETLSKERLLAEVWGNRHLTDATIAQAVRKARAALGDDGRTQMYFRTVHGRGIRFEADVTSGDAAAPPPAAASTPGLPVAAAGPGPASGWRVVAILLLLTGAWGLWLAFPGPGVREAPAIAAEPLPAATRIAVFPFENATGEVDYDWLRHGLPAAARDLLALAEGVEALGPRELEDVPEGDLDHRSAYVGARFGLTATVARKEGRFAVAWLLVRDDGGRHQGQFSTAEATLIARELVRQVLASARGVAPVMVSDAIDAGDPLALELYSRGMEAAMRNERAQAVKLLEAALARAPGSTQLKVAVAQVAFDPANVQGSIQRLREVMDGLPADASLARATLRFEVGKLLWFVGEMEQAEGLLRGALDDPGIDRLLRARVLNSLAMVEQSLLRFDVAWEHARAAESLLRQLDSPYFLAMALTNLGYLAEDMGRLAEAQQYHEEALGIRERSGFPTLVAASRYGLGRVLRRSGRFEEAEELVRMALDTAIGHDVRHDVFDNCEELAEIAMRLEKYEDAATWLEQARAVAESNDDALGLVWVRQLQGRLSLRSGSVTAATVAGHEGVVRDLEAVGERQDAQLARLELAQMHLALGRPDAAYGLLRRVADDLDAAGISGVALGHEVVNAQWLAARGERTGALSALLETIRHARASGAWDIEAEAAILAGHLALETGDVATAGRVLAIARAWSPGYYRTRELAQALRAVETGTGRTD